MKTPGPDHPITLEPGATRWRAQFAGHVIADSAEALILRESTYPPVVYFPRVDVEMGFMSRTDRGTHCPYKGDASYFTVLMDGQFAENAVWTYEQPFPAMEAIEGRLAFYTDKIEVYEVANAAAKPEQPAPPKPKPDEDFAITVDDVVQHTDSGSGNSQREHWAANVSTPASTDDGGLR
ncbi:DUF427 domain-containing protein [Phenylobacterium sp.]|uniref:DUF427 domain-containing protein n=1 Tax=Phenylobacterium sp. TaxID=1871053 RepID=UPI00121AF3A8|nr:DUF427 domain-containing protein [Phenylobacterium sp.]THD67111.1 MAG: DUF427 domain-containing protein [Phenylobacterium sp.]